MGEIAEMVLDGTLCEGCGEYMGDEVGFPRLCSSCQRASRAAFGSARFPQPRNPAKVVCEACGRHVKASGLKDHMRDKHGPQSNQEPKP